MATLGHQVISHSGPYFYPAGSLTAADKDEIFQKTGVSVNIRERKQWKFQRGLTASGPPQGVQEALELAHAKIMASVKSMPQADETVRAKRKEVAQAGRRQYERAQGSSTTSAEIDASAGASCSRSSHEAHQHEAIKAWATYNQMREAQTSQAHAAWAQAPHQWTTWPGGWHQSWSDWMAAQSAYAANANLLEAMQQDGEARPPPRQKREARPPTSARRSSSKGTRQDRERGQDWGTGAAWNYQETWDPAVPESSWDKIAKGKACERFEGCTSKAAPARAPSGMSRSQPPRDNRKKRGKSASTKTTSSSSSPTPSLRRRPARSQSRSATPRQTWKPKLVQAVKEEVKEEILDSPEMESASSKAEDNTLEARPSSRTGRRNAARRIRNVD